MIQNWPIVQNHKGHSAELVAGSAWMNWVWASMAVVQIW